jgi:hypothetical protein
MAMEELESFEKMLEPYKVYLLIGEFVVVPVVTILAGYALGNTSLGIPVAAGYIGADILVMITRHRTLRVSGYLNKPQLHVASILAFRCSSRPSVSRSAKILLVINCI